MEFNKKLYYNEMVLLVDRSIEQFNEDYPQIKVYTLSIWTDINSVNSSINFDTFNNSAKIVNEENNYNKKIYNKLKNSNNYKLAEDFLINEVRNTNPADFEFADYTTIENNSFKLNWGEDYDGDCWDIMEPLILSIGEYAFEKALIKLNIHKNFELSTNGKEDWYEHVWKIK